ncbi:MAG TPA: HpcH/HpaI aldolase/citrate lyase family protein [Burkholderiaceae bacterium]|nr:HpcH/HpaI aldolase/citrate lyase family protein [Burkholderiaceae bacterium]
MQHPVNPFKLALRQQRVQIGLWHGMGNAYVAEICASAGFDWMVIDAEHVPNTVPSILAQLQALAAYPVAPVVRPGWNDKVELKQLLDIGAQNFLIPMIETAHEAEQAVRSVRYPPQGHRGVANALARAAKWGAVTDYLERANEEICVLCQVETARGLENLDDILSVEGVDGVFIGPADLSASLGYINQPDHPEVLAVIDDMVRRVRAAGKAPGILHGNVEQARRFIEQGVLFAAVGVDAGLLRRAATDLLSEFRGSPHPGRSAPSVYG